MKRGDMDILDRLVEHDTMASQYLLAQCLTLSNEQWDTSFGFGQESIRKCWDHLVGSIEFWTASMKGNFLVEPREADAERITKAGIALRLEKSSTEFMELARQLRDQNRLEATFEDRFYGGVHRTFGACIVHVATHGMHHRAQIRAYFDMLGVPYGYYEGSALDELDTPVL
jgi:uncharacterized damage-inducible protein DinB